MRETQQNQLFVVRDGILDLHKPGQYGPRGFSGRRSFFYSGQGVSSGVGKMVDTRDDDPGKNRSDGKPSADEAALSARLTRLGQRLSHVRKDRQVEKSQAEAEEQSTHARASAMAIGLRLSSELVAGVLVGALLGWGFDRFLSTSPWGLIVFLMLGFIAGVMNVMRSAGVMAKQSERLKNPPPK
jgi:ATP synthase protein I